MNINYSELQTKAFFVIKSFGLPVSITRSGAKVASSFGVFVKNEAADETKSKTSVLAQTEQTTSTMILASIGTKTLMVGDNITCNKATFTITDIETVRPTTTALLYKVKLT